MALDVVHRKKTLGYFLKEMKKRASFDESLEESMDRFLASRNKLVHHFDEVPGAALASEVDIQAVNEFLQQLATDFEQVLIFCSALLHAWTERTGIAKGMMDQNVPVEARALIDRIKSLSGSIDAHIFATENRPNKAPEPTTTAVTPRAT